MLLKAAYSYSALCSYRIYYGLGKKGKFRSLEISFPADAFHHLAGFHYATRNPQLVSKRLALYNVKSRKITVDDFAMSKDQKMIVNRWFTIAQIENAMINARIIMEYTQNGGPFGSSIKAKFAILHRDQANKYYYFFDGKTDDHLVPVSCLIENEQQYERGCTKWTVLKIEKKSQDGSSSEAIYCHNALMRNAEL